MKELKKIYLVLVLMVLLAQILLAWSDPLPERVSKVAIHARILRLDYDAIGEYAIGVNDGSTLVRQADGGYLDCADAD